MTIFFRAKCHERCLGIIVLVFILQSKRGFETDFKVLVLLYCPRSVSVTLGSAQKIKGHYSRRPLSGTQSSPIDTNTAASNPSRIQKHLGRMFVVHTGWGMKYRVGQAHQWSNWINVMQA